MSMSWPMSGRGRAFRGLAPLRMMLVLVLVLVLTSLLPFVRASSAWATTPTPAFLAANTAPWPEPTHSSSPALYTARYRSLIDPPVPPPLPRSITLALRHSPLDLTFFNFSVADHTFSSAVRIFADRTLCAMLTHRASASSVLQLPADSTVLLAPLLNRWSTIDTTGANNNPDTAYEVRASLIETAADDADDADDASTPSTPSRAFLLRFRATVTWIDSTTTFTDPLLLDVLLHEHSSIVEMRFYTVPRNFIQPVQLGAARNSSLFLSLINGKPLTPQLHALLSGATVYFVPSHEAPRPAPDAHQPEATATAQQPPHLFNITADLDCPVKPSATCFWAHRNASRPFRSWNASFWPTTADMQTPDTFAPLPLSCTLTNAQFIQYNGAATGDIKYGPGVWLSTYLTRVMYDSRMYLLAHGFTSFGSYGARVLFFSLYHQADFVLEPLARTFGTYPDRVFVLRMRGHWADTPARYDVIDDAPFDSRAGASSSAWKDTDDASLVIDWCIFEVDGHLEVRYHSVPRILAPVVFLPRSIALRQESTDLMLPIDGAMQQALRDHIYIDEDDGYPKVSLPLPSLDSIFTFSSSNATYTIEHAVQPTPSLFHPTHFYTFTAAAVCVPRVPLIVVSLRMDFVFYGVRYTTVGIGAQNVLFFERLSTMNMPNSMKTSSYSAFGPYIAYAFASGGDTSSTESTSAASRCYETFGTAPNRVFVLRSTDLSSGLLRNLTVDVVLHEFDGTIDVHLYRFAMPEPSALTDYWRQPVTQSFPKILLGVHRPASSGNSSTITSDFSAAADSLQLSLDSVRAVVGSSLTFRSPSLRACVERAVNVSAVSNGTVSSTNGTANSTNGTANSTNGAANSTTPVVSPIEQCSTASLVGLPTLDGRAQADMSAASTFTMAQLDGTFSEPLSLPNATCLAGGFEVADVVPLRMNFVFFSRIYTAVVVGSSGTLQFESSSPVTFQGSLPFAAAEQFPARSFAFAGLPMQPVKETTIDLDGGIDIVTDDADDGSGANAPSTSATVSSSPCSRRYQTLGSFPDRLFVLQLRNVPAADSDGVATLDVLLFERNGSIVVRYYTMPSYSLHNMIIGMQGATNGAAAAGDDDDYLAIVNAIPIDSAIQRAIQQRAFMFFPRTASGVDLTRDYPACTSASVSAPTSTLQYVPSDGYGPSCFRAASASTDFTRRQVVSTPDSVTDGFDELALTRAPDVLRGDPYCDIGAPMTYWLPNTLYRALAGASASESESGSASASASASAQDWWVPLPPISTYDVARFCQGCEETVAYVPMRMLFPLGLTSHRYLVVYPNGELMGFRGRQSIRAFNCRACVPRDGVVRHITFVHPRNASISVCTFRLDVVVVEGNSAALSSLLTVDVVLFSDGTIEFRYERVPPRIDKLVDQPAMLSVMYRNSTEVVPTMTTVQWTSACRNSLQLFLAGRVLRLQRVGKAASNTSYAVGGSTDWRMAGGVYAHNDPPFAIRFLPRGVDLCALRSGDSVLPYWCTTAGLADLLPLDLSDDGDDVVCFPTVDASSVVSLPLVMPFPFVVRSGGGGGGSGNSSNGNSTNNATTAIISTLSTVFVTPSGVLVFNESILAHPASIKIMPDLTAFAHPSTSLRVTMRFARRYNATVIQFDRITTNGPTRIDVILYSSTGMIEVRAIDEENSIWWSGAELRLSYPHRIGVALSNIFESIGAAIGSRTFFYPVSPIPRAASGDGGGASTSPALFIALAMACTLSVLIVVCVLLVRMARTRVVVTWAGSGDGGSGGGNLAVPDAYAESPFEVKPDGAEASVSVLGAAAGAAARAAARSTRSTPRSSRRAAIASTVVNASEMELIPVAPGAGVQARTSSVGTRPRRQRLQAAPASSSSSRDSSSM